MKAKETVTLQILSTSDIHGKYLPFDYALNMEDPSGSLAQILTAVKELRTENENTVLVDIGDDLQGNFAELFLDDEEHPYVTAANLMDYDVWTPGNHDFNYGLSFLKKVLSGLKAKVLIGNVKDPEGNPLSDGYAIIERGGVKIGIIGMVTSNINRWDAKHLESCEITNPTDETIRIVKEIRDRCDVIIAAEHMSEQREYEVTGTGANDLAEACPDIDVILAAHAHHQVDESFVNGVLITENKGHGQTLSAVSLTLEMKEDGRYDLVGKSGRTINAADYDPDIEMMQALADANRRAKKEAVTVVGMLEGGSLLPENEIEEIPQARIEETPLIHLINKVQMYYGEADLSATCLFSDHVLIKQGEILKSDLALIYKYENTLYRLRINGAQLRKYLEWNAGYFNTLKEGDLTISFNPDVRSYNYDLFTGIRFETNISKEPGTRIENLAKADGTPVKDDDLFILAVNNYRANTQLLNAGPIFGEGEELPELLDVDVHGELGGIREMICDYIQNVSHGILWVPELPGGWKLTGIDWEPTDHEAVVEALKEGSLSFGNEMADHWMPPSVSITKEDLQKWREKTRQQQDKC